MTSSKKTVIAGLVGLVYGLFLGFISILATGGGHGNFGWALIFVFVDFFGLYYLLMAAFAVNLGSMFTKIIYGTLFCFNLLVSTFMIANWIIGTPDFERAWSREPFSIMFLASLRALPVLVFGFLFVREILFGPGSENDKDFESLNLS